jgi:hypothetical protein
MRPATLLGVAFVLLGGPVLPTAAKDAHPTVAIPTGSLEIHVVDDATGAPVPYANIVRTDASRGWLANAEGVCQPPPVPAGPVGVRVVHVSYETSPDVELLVRSGEVTRTEIRLVAHVHELESVAVSADRSFDLRTETHGARTIGAEAAAVLPNPTDDAFQMLRVLPGVTSGDIGSEFRLRGGGIDETLVRIDGLDVRELFHGRDFGGITGIVPFSAVERMDVYAGGFPASYGGRLSGVIDLALRERGPEGFHGRVAADVASARAMVESHGARGSAFFSARQGYLDQVLGTIATDAVIEPAYRDFLGRAVLRPSAAMTVSLNALWAEDRARYEDGVEDHFVDAEYRDRYAWTTLRWLAGARVATRFTGWVAESRQQRRLSEGRREDHALVRGGASGEAGVLWGAHLLTVGGQWERQGGDYELAGRDVVVVAEDGTVVPYESLDRTGDAGRVQTAAFVQDEWELGRLALNAGYRVEHDDLVGGVRGYPRASAAFEVTSSTLVRGAWGRYGQYPTAGLSGPAELQILSERTQQGEHRVVGLEQRLGGVRLGADAYDKSYDVLDGVISRTVGGETQFRPVTGGSARGIELWLRRTGNRTSWWLAYSMGRARWTDGDRVYSRDFDQLHTLSVANTWQLGRNWDFGVSYRYHSGTPYTRQTWASGESAEWLLTEGVPNAQRLPDYHRVDVRVRRWFRFQGWDMSLYADALNLTNHDNVLWYAWRFRDPDGSRRSDPERITRTGVPGIPSLGLEVHW